MNDQTQFATAAMTAQIETSTRKPAPAACSEVGVALSIRQPWCWLILHAGKDIENRSWPTRFRGRVLIHASKGMTEQEYRDCCRFLSTDSRLEEAFQKLPSMELLKRGGIIGEAEVTDCVTESESPWFAGEYGFVLRNAKPLEFRLCNGALGFFKPQNAQDQVRPSKQNL